ncbi:hypothetical protein V2G26_017602 [Clonostachys chloroleuca]
MQAVDFIERFSEYWLITRVAGKQLKHIDFGNSKKTRRPYISPRSSPCRTWLENKSIIRGLINCSIVSAGTDASV